MRESKRVRFEWMPSALAAIAFVVFVAAFFYELVSYQGMAVEWANGDINSRAHLAAANLEEPLRTQDFMAIQRVGDACEKDGVHLLITSSRGGVVFNSCPRDIHDLPFYSERCQSGEYWVSIGMPNERMMAPFKKAIRGFFLAGLVGIAGVLLFFFVTYRQRVHIRELNRLEKFRSEFIADVSHEIKTPLTGILGAVDMLEQAGGTDEAEQQKLLVGLIRKESKRLNGLVQSILDLARLEREECLVRRELVDVCDLVRETVATLRAMAVAAGVELTEVLPLDGVKASMDARLVSQAISNLIVNAIRHSQSKDVVVSVVTGDKSVEIVVEDHGIGIPPEHASRIFERFYRVDPSRTADTGGAGLGLAIVQRIVALHGARLSLFPSIPHGCRFVLSMQK